MLHMPGTRQLSETDQDSTRPNRRGSDDATTTEPRVASALLPVVGDPHQPEGEAQQQRINARLGEHEEHPGQQQRPAGAARVQGAEEEKQESSTA